MKLKISHKHPSPPTGYEELLLRVGLQKDREAFVELFHHFAPRIKSYLLKHGADDAAAEEAVQSTMITVWEKAAGYSPTKAAASTWIFTIARNKRIDALRREKFIDVNSDSPALTQAVQPALADTYADDLDIEKLSSALKDLPEDQSRLVHMAFFEDKSHQSISNETRLPLGTVKSRLRLALEKLRRTLRRTQP